jgi:hypothetical protein
LNQRRVVAGLDTVSYEAQPGSEVDDD